MRIDLRNTRCFWINLVEHKKNAEMMHQLLKTLKITNHLRVPGIRVSGFEQVAYGQKVDHYMGVGLAQMNAIQLAGQNLPCLVLEDDVQVTQDWNPILDIPDNTDAVYLGVSSAGNAYGYKINESYAKIFNVLGAHAILYINPRFVSDVLSVSKSCLFDNRAPFDIALSQLIVKYNVITPLRPYFFQSNEKESANKWQELTSKPLKIYERPTNS